MSEPFALRNDPPKRKPWKAENALPARQAKLFTGCNDLPGQSSLFNADGPKEIAPARDPMTPPAGCVGITAEHRAEIEAQLVGLWDVLRVEHTWSRLTFYVNQNPNVWSRKILDRERDLMQKYGNAPHLMATDFTTYRLTFIANR